MDKNTYETYEFLPANGSEPEPDQFFVVQDDGTFLLNRQIQYVGQVQDVKEVLDDVQPCTVYGVSSQQFFVDVDNSAELISVSDQFILPDADNGLYTNSYLLQPSSSTPTEPMEDVAVDQYKQPDTQDVDIDVVTHDSKQGNHFTEITLSDDQYQTLEQKGWILLESNDKIFVLNTLGLHDITTNDKLIQKLKSEIQNSNNLENDGRTLKIESVSSDFPNIVSDPLISKQEMVEFEISADNEQHEAIENVQFIIDDSTENKEGVQQLDPTITNEDLERSDEKPELPAEPIEVRLQEKTKEETFCNKDASSIKIKTKFNFKDIPDKVILGKSPNGKMLVAKVTKLQSNKDNVDKNTPSDDVVFKQIAGSENYNTTSLHETDFVNLLQATLRAADQPNVCEDDIASANTVITQLLKVPNLKQSFIGHNLIVTKATNNKDEFGAIYNRSKVTLMTGQVKESEEKYSFEHIPYLLQTIKLKSEEQNISPSNEAFSCIEDKEAKENFSIYHVHITESKCPDNVVRVSVTLNKRQLPVNLNFDLKRRYPSTVFGCSGCAALFKTEEALKVHQESQCMETDMTNTDPDQPNIDDEVIIMKTDSETIFTCARCNVKSTKLCNIQRHMKVHQPINQQILEMDKKTNQETQDQTNKFSSYKYKCKMCPSTYIHSASLSKHIVTRHIKVKSNKNVV